MSAGLTKAGQVMLVAEAFGAGAPTRIKFSCPAPGCKASDNDAFKGSASNIMRHFRFHPEHLDGSIVLFASCQIQQPSGRRFTYISDEYGEVGNELLVKERMSALALHAKIPATAASTDSDHPTSSDTSRRRSKPATFEPALQPPKRQSRGQMSNDARWARQDLINNAHASMIRRGDSRMQDLQDRNEVQDETLQTLLDLTETVRLLKAQTEASLALVETKCSHLQRYR